MDRKIGRSSVFARSSASGPHGYQSTGLCACWSRYGLVSSARRLGMPPVWHVAFRERLSVTNGTNSLRVSGMRA